MHEPDTDAAWSAALADLERWHFEGERDSARAALAFIEPELRLAVPRTVPRRWPAEQVEDALQGFLLRLLERPLPPSIRSSPGGYIVRSFKNWCLDIERGRRRAASEPWEDDASPRAARQEVEARDQVRRMNAGLSQLRVEDRVALKLEAAPETLADDEWRWLAERSGLPQDVVRSRILGAEDVYALTLVFDPGPEPLDTKGRRDRMERFRKRRERARDALWRALGEVP